MIPFNEAYQMVLNNVISLPDENISLLDAGKRILAEDILADRDFPPFNRATKDGIVLNYKSVENGHKFLELKGTIPAGSAGIELPDEQSALEIMTGAVVPANGDTVVMYEELEIEGNKVSLPERISKGQNIHLKGSDLRENDCIIKSPKVITPSETGILASVGKHTVKVKKLPRVAVISTGNELVEINETPRPYQIRKSNTYSIKAALEEFKINASFIHLKDDKAGIVKTLEQALQKYDVLLLSGGVSKGKYDHLPDAFATCGVKKIFHKVLQRPGKPFWFGKHTASQTTIFSFPGNPVSTFASFYIYFIPWLKESFGFDVERYEVVLGEDFQANEKLTLFVPVKIVNSQGKLVALKVRQNGSGDLTSLTNTDGFVRLPPAEIPFVKGTAVPFVSTNYLNY